MFEGAGRPLSEAALARAADEIGVGRPALWAVMTVETKGCGFLPDRRPQILYERHIFHRRTGGRFDAQAPDLSHAVPGGYGKAGAFQHDRLARAIVLDRRAALESTSWGLGQIMGFNSGEVGFSDVEPMVDAMCASEDAQFGAVVEFIRSEELAPALQRADWSSFARRYNGEDFQKNAYDKKLAKAFARYLVGPLPDLHVRAAQVYLSFLHKNPGTVDGWFGQQTQAALIRFQSAQGLAPSGSLDEATFAALEAAAQA